MATLPHPIHSTPLADESRLAAWLLGLGAAGVMVTCACYILAGPVAALPGGTSDFELARLATLSAAGWMRTAGVVGMPGDVLMVAGCTMIAAMRQRAGATTSAVGWGLLALSCLLFVLVDALVGYVLPPVASGSHAGSYALARSLFDVLFSIGGWTLGLGALLATRGEPGPELAWAPLRSCMALAGVLGLLANTSHLLGGPGAPLIGAAVVLTTVAALGAALGLLQH